MIIPNIITNISKTNTSNKSSQKVSSSSNGSFYVIDNLNMLNNDVTPLKQAFPGYNFQIKSASDENSLLTQVKKDGKLYLLVFNIVNGNPDFEYYCDQYVSGLDIDSLQPVIRKIYATSLLKSAGVDTAMATKILSSPSVTINELGKGYIKGVFSGILISIVMFFSIYLFCYGVATSVASEKTSRVMETLVTSTKPSRIILGKTAAMGLLGACQLTLMLFTAIITYILFFPKNFEVFGQSINFSAFSPLVIIMIIIYFILGYLIYAMLNAVAGASVSKSEDVNTAIVPISMITMLSFYVAYIPSTIPNSTYITTLTSIIPLTSPFSMPSRLIMTNVPPIELITSILLLLGTIVLLSWVSIRIYSAAILHYGNRLKLKDIISMTKNNK